MAFIDYYKVLEIDKKATETEIKKAYRKMARKYHPDLNPNDKQAELKFKQLNEANEVLSNPENRKKYDQYGENWEHGAEHEKAKQQQTQKQGSRSQGGFGGFEGGDYSDFFESMFAGQGGRTRNTGYKGQDFNAELNLDLKDVYSTHKRTLTINGKNIRLTIEAGIENGQVIKIAGFGAEGTNGGPKGDLFITFTITNNTNFKRDRDHLYSTVKIDLFTAVLGGDITVEAFEGKVKLKVEPGTQNGTQIKLKGKGFPIYKKEKEFGNLYITYEVRIPKNISEKEKELFTQLSNLRTS
jgi:curved DNA-binding protein